MSVVLITGASTGIGNLTARALGVAGHTVYASMRDLGGKNAEHAQSLAKLSEEQNLDIHAIPLDVQSQGSADAAIQTVLERSGQLDVVVHNAGHLYVGYVESFTAEDIARLMDINALGVQRVNRAALPHMRQRRAGVLVYVGSTIIVTTPPFLGPYVASKAAFDALAVVTSYEVGQFGIETSIVMPGAFTSGTQHFPQASRASDGETAAAYSDLDPMVARNEEATESLMRPGADADPVTVAEEIERIIALPFGEKPFRSVVDFTDSDVDGANRALQERRESFVERMGFGELLTVRH